MAFLAQVDIASTAARWVEVAIVIAAVIGIGLVVLQVTGVQIPGWVKQIGWILVVAVVALAAINILMRMIS